MPSDNSSLPDYCVLTMPSIPAFLPALNLRITTTLCFHDHVFVSRYGYLALTDLLLLTLGFVFRPRALITDFFGSPFWTSACSSTSSYHCGSSVLRDSSASLRGIVIACKQRVYFLCAPARHFRIPATEPIQKNGERALGTSAFLPLNSLTLSAALALYIHQLYSSAFALRGSIREAVYAHSALGSFTPTPPRDSIIWPIMDPAEAVRLRGALEKQGALLGTHQQNIQQITNSLHNVTEALAALTLHLKQTQPPPTPILQPPFPVHSFNHEQRLPAPPLRRKSVHLPLIFISVLTRA